jgi:hypothetical protein
MLTYEELAQEIIDFVSSRQRPVDLKEIQDCFCLKEAKVPCNGPLKEKEVVSAERVVLNLLADRRLYLTEDRKVQVSEAIRYECKTTASCSFEEFAEDYYLFCDQNAGVIRRGQALMLRLNSAWPEMYNKIDNSPKYDCYYSSSQTPRTLDFLKSKWKNL